MNTGYEEPAMTDNIFDTLFAIFGLQIFLQESPSSSSHPQQLLFKALEKMKVANVEMPLLNPKKWVGSSDKILERGPQQLQIMGDINHSKQESMPS